MNKWWLIIGIFFTSCYSGYNLKTVSYYQLFNDGNSKVWLVDQIGINDSNVGPKENKLKNVFIFFSSGDFQYTAMKNIASDSVPTGSYHIDSEERRITMYINDESWSFDLAYVEEDSIYLLPRANSENKFSYKLIPLPPL